MLIEKRYWAGLVNGDDADFVIGKDEYVNSENLRFGMTDFAEGAVGFKESPKGTLLIPNDLFPGTNITVGALYDYVRNRILYFNFHETNEFGAAGIYCLDIDVKIIRPVLILADLGITPDCIHSCFILNGNLYWVNSTNSEPKRINIDSGIKLNDPSYQTDAVAYTLPISLPVLSWIRRPPAYPPVIEKVTQTIPALVTNFIKGDAFQMSYRYEFRDHEVSTLSGYSTLSNYNRETDTFNRVDVTIPLAEFIDQDVLQVDLVVRYVSGNYYIIKSWNKNIPAEAQEIADHNMGSTALSYAFYNDQTGIALDSAYAAKPFDSVPIYAETAATAKGRSFLGNITTGYDTPMLTSLTATGVPGTPTDRLFKSDDYYQVAITFYDEYQRKTGYLAPPGARVQTPDRIYGTFTTPDYFTQILWNLSNTNAANEIPITARYYTVDITRSLRTRFFLQLRGKNSTYVRKNQDGTFEFGISEYSADLAGCAFDISTLSTFGMGYVFAEGDIFKYYRYTDLNFSLAITGQQGVYVITELQNLGTLNATIGFMFEIYTPYKPSTNEPAYEVGFMYPVINSGTGTQSYSTLSGFFDGDVYIRERTDSNKAFYTINTVPEARNDDQDATLGVVSNGTAAPTTDFSTGDSPFQDLVGFNIATNTDRVIYQNDTGADQTVQISGNVKLMPDSDRTWRAYIADNLNTQTIIVPDTAMTAGVIKNFTFNQSVTVAAGNRLFIFHHQSVANSMYFYELNLTFIVPSTTLTYDAEAMSPNDKYYKNWNFPDTGRPNLIDTIGQQTLTGNIAFSNTFSEGTKNNGLSSFEALNVKNLPAECGPLRKLQPTSKVNEQGVVMLGICEAETVSMYLGEVQLVGASANAFVAQSDNVIGTINVLKGNFGTVNPESVKEFRGNVYWFDLRNGKYIQYSSNGLFPISNYKLSKFWRLFSEQFGSMTPQEIEALGSRPFVFTGVDMHNEEMLVSVPKVGDPPRGYLPDFPEMIYPFDICDFQAKSLVYRLNVEPNRWQGSYNVTAENFVNGQDELYSFKNGEMYLHNAGPFCNFYGVQYRSRLMIVANQEPGEPKVYFNNHVRCNLIPVFTYFRSEEPYVQASDLADTDYANIEGVFYAALFRNKLIPTASGYTTNGLLTAEVIRTDALRALYEWEVSDTPVQLRFISIGYQMSRGHLK